jgi:uncharacterized protein YbjT (DUF2867 family)
VTGPQALTFGEAAEAISGAAGYPVVFEGDPEAFAALRAMGDTEPGQDVLRAPKDSTDYAADAAPAWHHY